MKQLKVTAFVFLATLLCLTSYGVWSNLTTRKSLDAFHKDVYRQALSNQTQFNFPQALPSPVERYFKYVFPNGVPDVAIVKVMMAGDFRRPLHDEFNPTTAKQSLSPALPALMFEAETPIFPGIWAIAYDAYLGGQMEMKAKIFGAFSVMDQPGTPELNKISLRRWLLEAPLYPQALIPSQYVRWEAVDDKHARVYANYQGLETSLLAEIDTQGKLLSLRAESDGDLTTPYHGSGEFAARSDYRMVDGMMIPHKYVIARHAQGVDYPFWKGEITSYSTKLYSSD